MLITGPALNTQAVHSFLKIGVDASTKQMNGTVDRLLGPVQEMMKKLQIT